MSFDEDYLDDPAYEIIKRDPGLMKLYALRHKFLTEDNSDVAKNFKVVIRVRPPIHRELADGFRCCVKVSDAKAIALSDVPIDSDEVVVSYSNYQFTFDQVYDQQATQTDVYNNTARIAVESSLCGYNASIIAYGQTGAGKTFTMHGCEDGSRPGIVPRAIKEIFDFITDCKGERINWLVRASYLQIYNDEISDLLKPERTNLTIRESSSKGIYVEGLSEWIVRSPDEVYSLMDRGAEERAVAATDLNDVSSRSHAIFILVVEQSEVLGSETDKMFKNEVTHMQNSLQATPHAKKHKIVRTTTDDNRNQVIRIGKLNLVDLAGSERVRKAGASGARFTEATYINRSLSTLGNVISALNEKKLRSHIPYRDSKLTRVLADSIGGNTKTTMIANISPALDSFVETRSTLKFANRAKNIKNEAKVNEDLNQKALIRRYERELKHLREQLKNKNFSSSNLGVDVSELEERAKKADADKTAALTALEVRSKEFFEAQKHKRVLEEKIKLMQSQLFSSDSVRSNPVFNAELQKALKEEKTKLESQFKFHVSQLKKSSTDDLQVDKYKQLLLKQRDIMLSMTARIHSREFTIINLGDRIKHYQNLIGSFQQEHHDDDVLRLKIELNQSRSDLQELQNFLKDKLEHLVEEQVDVKVRGLQEENRMLTERIERMSSVGGTTTNEEAETKLTAYYDDKIKALSSTLREKNETIEQLRNQIKEQPHVQQQKPVISRDHVAALEQFHNRIMSERTALRTILETKIKVLSDNILHYFTSSDSARTLREIANLQKLVSAAIQALHSADQDVEFLQNRVKDIF
ncbi:hypothetical protein PCE1_003101 [Barthelona sp. PCE]